MILTDILCINCYNCKKLNDLIFCKNGYFSEKIHENDNLILTPFDFDCYQFDKI